MTCLSATRWQLGEVSRSLDEERRELQMLLERQAERDAEWEMRRQRIASVDAEDLDAVEVAELLVNNQFMHERNESLESQLTQMRSDLKLKITEAQRGASCRMVAPQSLLLLCTYVHPVALLRALQNLWRGRRSVRRSVRRTSKKGRWWRMTHGTRQT